MLKLIQVTRLCAIVLLLPAVVLAQDQNWQIAKSTHFNVFYKNAPENAVNELIQKAEECYDSIANELGFNRFNFWTWDNRAKIYLYDSRDEYLKLTQSSDWSGGQVNIGAKVIQSYVGAPGFLQNVMPHELAHIIFIEMVGLNNPGVPLWLQEGVAGYQEENIEAIKSFLEHKINSGNFLNLNVLNNFQIKNSPTEKVELFYAEAYSLVKYLIARFGKDAFVDFCRRLRDDRNLLQALIRTYSFKDFNDFEESWRTFLLT